MKLNAYVIGVGMTRFGKHLDRGLKSLGGEAVIQAIEDTGVDKEDIQAAFMANATAGLMTGQEMIRGQVVLHSIGIHTIPVINIENACASASTAFGQACALVSAGCHDLVLAVGTEKMYHTDRTRTMQALSAAVDVEELDAILAGLQEKAAQGGAKNGTEGAGKNHSMFMDLYAARTRAHMEAYGTTVEQFAAVSVKNAYHGSLNERAQFRNTLTVDEVLNSPMIAEPLTRTMCCPVGDGAAAAVIASETKVRELGLGDRAVRVLTSVLHSGVGGDRAGTESAAGLCAKEAYEDAGLGPEDLSVIELHDASAPAEVMAYETLRLCPKGEGGKLVADGATQLNGRLPVNTSGGLLRKGHPVGATGIAQIVELVEQLQGRSGERQVKGARVGLAHNNGGSLGADGAAACVTILSQ